MVLTVCLAKPISGASRRSAVGLAGYAPRLMPSRGHPALIPDASGPVGLRAALAHPSSLRAGCGRSCCSLHRITAFSPSRAAHALRACVLAAVADPLPLALRRAEAGSGQFRPSNRSTIMSQLSLSLDSSLLVRDDQGRYLPATADQILEAARYVIDQKIPRGTLFTSPALVKDYLRTKLASFEHEV